MYPSDKSFLGCPLPTSWVDYIAVWCVPAHHTVAGNLSKALAKLHIGPVHCLKSRGEATASSAWSKPPRIRSAFSGRLHVLASSTIMSRAFCAFSFQCPAIPNVISTFVLYAGGVMPASNHSEIGMDAPARKCLLSLGLRLSMGMGMETVFESRAYGFTSLEHRAPSRIHRNCPRDARRHLTGETQQPCELLQSEWQALTVWAGCPGEYPPANALDVRRDGLIVAFLPNVRAIGIWS